MAEYHVGCGLAGIYAGTLKNNNEWKNKSDVTDEALCAVAQYLDFGKKEFRIKYNGEPYRLIVEKMKERTDG